MGASNLIFRRKAEEDIAAIAAYIAGDSRAAAERFFAALANLCELLISTPSIGSARIFQSPRLTEMRMIPLKNFEKYLVFYRFTGDAIEILRVIHGARDYPLLFDE